MIASQPNDQVEPFVETRPQSLFREEVVRGTNGLA